MSCFIKQLTISIVLILSNSLCVCDIKELESLIKERADNDEIIKDELGIFNLKLEKDGKLGSGAFAIVWKSKNYFT